MYVYIAYQDRFMSRLYKMYYNLHHTNYYYTKQNKIIVKILLFRVDTFALPGVVVIAALLFFLCFTGASTSSSIYS